MAAPPPPSRRSFRFREKIGSGAFGEVYLAELITGGGFAKVVAVKVLKPEFLEETDIVSRMRDEARLLGHLRHPAIVQADDLLMLGGRVAIVMEYVPGVNLLSLIHPKRNPLPPPPGVLCAILGRVAEALEAAWSRPSALTGEPLRVLHRDIKPSNIRVTPDGEVKVLDFGVARSDALERETSTHNQLIGSLTFLAPEVFLSHPVLPATDVYALGVTFYESIARSRFGRCGLSAEYHHELLAERLAALDLTDWGGCAEPARQLLGEMLAFEPIHRPTAAGVARSCAGWCRAMSGAELRDWAGEHVVRVAAATKGDPDGELVGLTLDEDSSHRSMVIGAPPGSHPGDGLDEDEDTAVERPKRGIWLAVLLVILLVVPAVVAVGAGVAWYLDARPPVARSVPAPAPAGDPAGPEVSTSSRVEPRPPERSVPGQEAPSLADAWSPDPAVEPAPEPTAPRAPSALEPAAPEHAPAPQPRPQATPAQEPSPRRSPPQGSLAPEAPVEQAPPTPRPSSEPVAVAEPAAVGDAGGTLSLKVNVPRRSLRNSQLAATVDTGVTGCEVTMSWKTEGLQGWESVGLSGSGPVYSWSLDVTGQHRPAILYYVTVTGCGEGGAHSAGAPGRIAVL
jgi:tRNA A-37 threonylcarbamoyl transferase component Bud32